MKKPRTSARILMLDIETAPSKAYVWGLFNQNISLNQIMEPGYTLCFAAQWYGEREKLFFSIHHDGMKRMLTEAHALLEEADIVVHYNGNKFDIPTLNREFIKHGFIPPSDAKHIDLLAVVRKQFRFQSNKLDFVAQELGLGSKVKHKGMELWNECMAGDDKAWRTMRKYNMQDTSLLISLYERVRPWVPAHPNMALFVANVKKPTCPHCASTNLVKWGTRATQVRAYQRYKCNDCGAYSRSRTAVAKAPAGVLMGR